LATTELSMQIETDPRLPGLGKDTRLIPQDRSNFEMPIALAETFITPLERFFIRSNGQAPSFDVNPTTWSLSIGGTVANSVSLTLADLQAMPSRTITAFLECSGNSRNRFRDVEGTNWGEGAVGNATWTGVPLADVLALANPLPETVDLVSQGADFETMQRGLPIETACNGDVLLAWAMNGAPLLPAHGSPLRMIVPGWGAIASTKWLTSLTAIDHQFDGFWNADNYVLYDESGRAVDRVREMPVKSVIVSPGDGDSVASGPIDIMGFAWSGHGGVASVEISNNAGQTWTQAEIVAEDGPYAWVQFRFRSQVAGGENIFLSRATDHAGHVQPAQARWNRKGYQMNAIKPQTIIGT